nr:Chain A, Designed peptide PH1 [synthetic construct]
WHMWNTVPNAKQVIAA